MGKYKKFRMMYDDFKNTSPEKPVPICRETKDNSPVRSAGIWNEIKIVRSSPLQKTKYLSRTKLNVVTTE